MFLKTNGAPSAPRLLLVLVILLLKNKKIFVFAKEFDSSCDSYETVITLADNIKSCSKVLENHAWKCPDLETALEMNSSLSNTCIDLNNRLNGEILTKVHVFNNSRHVKIYNGKINCGKTLAAALSFVDGELIVFTKLDFYGCGSLHPSHYRRNHNNYSEDNVEGSMLNKMELTAAINFHNVSEITLTDVAINSFHGYGIVLTDCTGSITLYNIKLEENTPAKCVFEDSQGRIFEFGGGVMFRHISDTLLYGTRFLVSSQQIETTFRSLRGVNYPNDHEIFSYLSPFGNGAGISIYLYKSTMTEILLENSNSSNNTGIFGGAFYLHHGDFSTNNIIRLNKLVCTLNTAINSGGCIYYVSNRCPYERNNTLVLDTFYHMSSNKARHGFGGAFCNYFRFKKTNHNAGDPAFVRTFVKGFVEQINNNDAKLGSAFFLENIEIVINDISFDTNGLDSNHLYKSNGFGAVYLYKSHFYLQAGNVTFKNNKATGLVLDNSYLHLKGTLNFISNFGIKGGGMTLIERSQIIVEDSKARLYVKNNKANIGGGIHVSFENATWKSFYIPEHKCFFRFAKESNEARIIFENNSKNDIFATSLRPCASNISQLTSFFLDSPEFHFDNENPLITDPVRIYFPKSEVLKNMYPGKTLVRVPLQIFDETDTTVSSDVKLVFKNTGGIDVNLTATEHNRLVVVNNTVEFRLLVAHKPRVTFDLEFSITVVDGIVERQTREAVFSYCPFGYRFLQDKCVCDPNRNNNFGIVDCDYTTGDITVFSNMWFDPTVKKLRQDAVRGIHCPNNYCRTCNSYGENETFCIFNKTNQCSSGRDQSSLLCSSCEQGRYLEWGSEKCVTNGHWYYIFVVVILEFLLVTTIVFLNSDIYDAYLPSVIFFYQAVRFFLSTTQDNGRFITLVLTAVSFDGTGGSSMLPIIFGSKLTNYWKIVPTLLLIILALIFLSIAIPLRAYLQLRFTQSANDADDGQFRCVSLFAYLFRETNYKAVVFMIIYIYGALSEVCTQAITLITLDGSTRFYIEARSTFSYSLKMIFSFLYLIIFLVVLIFPFSIVFPCFEMKFFSCCREFFRHIRFLFRAPFRDEKSKWVQLFPCFYLLVGNLLKIFHVVMIYLNWENQTMLTIFTLLAVFILLAFALTKPYKPTSGPILNLNTFDTFVLCMLCVVGVISNGKQRIRNVNSADKSLNSVVKVLLWLPLGTCIIMNLIRFSIFVAFICSKKNEQGILRTYVTGGYENEHSSVWAKAKLDQQQN